MKQGWIKIHRSILNWEWYDDSNTLHLFLHLLLNANHKEKKWRGHLIKQGERITSQQHLAKELGLSVRQIRTSLDKLKLTGELTVKTTNKYSLIKINNWDKYQQDDRQDDIVKSVKRQADDRQATTNNNNNKDNNENNVNKRGRFTPPSLEEVTKYCLERSNGIDAEQFIDFYTSKGWMVGSSKMKDWRASVRNWEKRNKTTDNEEKDINQLTREKYGLT